MKSSIVMHTQKILVKRWMEVLTRAVYSVNRTCE